MIAVWSRDDCRLVAEGRCLTVAQRPSCRRLGQSRNPGQNPAKRLSPARQGTMRVAGCDVAGDDAEADERRQGA